MTSSLVSALLSVNAVLIDRLLRDHESPRSSYALGKTAGSRPSLRLEFEDPNTLWAHPIKPTADHLKTTVPVRLYGPVLLTSQSLASPTQCPGLEVMRVRTPLPGRGPTPPINPHHWPQIGRASCREREQ